MYIEETTFIVQELIRKKNLLFPQSNHKYVGLIHDSVSRCASVLRNTDALYHNLEHTALVTLCGQDIFVGKKVLDGGLSIEDWIHYTIALLFHDVGYVRNILRDDFESNQVVNASGDTIEIPPNSTDAYLTPYHVERSQIFLKENNWSDDINVDLICEFIKNTMFPVPTDRVLRNIDAKQSELSELVIAADLIGQLADPSYYRKIPALYYEFKETGANIKLGYNVPMDVKKSYPAFFYNYVQPKIFNALTYLNTTNEGQFWAINLNYHVFCEEHRSILSSEGIMLLEIISKKMSDSRNFEDTLSFILGKICKFQKWPVGHAYYRNEESQQHEMAPTNIWHIDAKTKAIENFVQVTSTTNFRIGRGLPGRVLESGKAEWIQDVSTDSNFPRARLAQDIGVKGAFAFPITDKVGVRYVLEFYSLNVEKPDASTLSFMSQIGYEISKYL